MMYNNKLVASVKVGGKIMREDGETVYLPFGSEYSLLLKNLNTQKAQVKIEIDGEEVTGGGLLISPNQSVDLERFILNDNLTTGPRFKFIEKTEQISDYRGDKIEDGIVRISYQFEAVQPTYYTTTNVFYNHTLGGNGGHSVGGNQVYGTGMRGMSVGSSISSTMDGSVTTSNLTGSNDAGITAKGSESNQKFSYGHIGALEAREHVICLNLKGQVGQHVVQAPVTVSRKIRCENCGQSNLLAGNHFCPKCGTNLTSQW